MRHSYYQPYEFPAFLRLKILADSRSLEVSCNNLLHRVDFNSTSHYLFTIYNLRSFLDAKDTDTTLPDFVEIVTVGSRICERMSKKRMAYKNSDKFLDVQVIE